ncbi:hypothetical protein PSTT_07827 [Puccinia striiformis]|uniref:Uncharacterized protein n=1 Tax=Puccinia striiformis TaxID=27350 RepID=A0A2S4VEX4_9BASI|nr:hypothetical protein PSTT_07827 [Puccinia striiformis]
MEQFVDISHQIVKLGFSSSLRCMTVVVARSKESRRPSVDTNTLSASDYAVVVHRHRSIVQSPARNTTYRLQDSDRLGVAEVSTMPNNQENKQTTPFRFLKAQKHLGKLEAVLKPNLQKHIDSSAGYRPVLQCPSLIIGGGCPLENLSVLPSSVHPSYPKLHVLLEAIDHILRSIQLNNPRGQGPCRGGPPT